MMGKIVPPTSHHHLPVDLLNPGSRDSVKVSKCGKRHSIIPTVQDGNGPFIIETMIGRVRPGMVEMDVCCHTRG